MSLEGVVWSWKTSMSQPVSPGAESCDRLAMSQEGEEMGGLRWQAGGAADGAMWRQGLAIQRVFGRTGVILIFECFQ